MNFDEDFDIILDNSYLYDFIYQFNTKGKVEKHLKKIISDNNDMYDDTFVSYFNMDEYVYDIKKSYQNDINNIYVQFEKDISRQNIKLNNKKYDSNRFLSILDNVLDNDVKYFNMSCKDLIVMLCCQSSFSLSYEILSGLYVSSLLDKVLVSNAMNGRGISVNVIINKDKIIMELNNKLHLKDINTNTNTHEINANITLELDKKINKLNVPKICVFSWRIRRADKQ